MLRLGGWKAGKAWYPASCRKGELSVDSAQVLPSVTGQQIDSCESGNVNMFKGGLKVSRLM